jgi:hypothetical protein
MSIFRDKFGRPGWEKHEWEALSTFAKLRYNLTTWDPRPRDPEDDIYRPESHTDG